jgi:hypothetical protein
MARPVDARKRGSPAKRGTSWSTLCKLATKLPGVEQGTSYGTPALHVRKKFLARLKEDGESVAIKIDFSDRDVLLELDPAAFYLTDHYRPYPAMLVRLRQVRVDLLEQLLEQAWRLQAPKSLLAEATRDRIAGPQTAPPRRRRRQVKGS